LSGRSPFAVANGHTAASPTDRLGRGKLMVPLEKTKLAPPALFQGSAKRCAPRMGARASAIGTSL